MAHVWTARSRGAYEEQPRECGWHRGAREGTKGPTLVGHSSRGRFGPGPYPESARRRFGSDGWQDPVAEQAKARLVGEAVGRTELDSGGAGDEQRLDLADDVFGCAGKGES